MTTIVETERLILRTWRKEDTDHCFQINQDPKVMEYFPGLQDLNGRGLTPSNSMRASITNNWRPVSSQAASNKGDARVY